MKLKFALALILAISSLWGSKHITFTSSDGVVISADLYMDNNKTTKPFIVLFHRASWSRGEYEEIAPKLNKLGFNTMAIDQRSGSEVNLVENETKKDAVKKGKQTNYINALIDLKSALKYARDNYAKGKLIAWGSSYSSSLAIVVAAENRDLVDAVISFSPGEYYKKTKGKNWIAQKAAKLKVPIFITSKANEKTYWYNIYSSITSPKKFYLPKKGGHHGSEALWEEYPTSKGYWSALISFLSQFK